LVFIKATCLDPRE